jgi:hypothetical protein
MMSPSAQASIVSFVLSLGLLVVLLVNSLALIMRITRDQNLMLLLESERKRRQLFAALLASASSTAAAQALAKL